MKPCHIIGLTGPSGAGKSTVAAVFAEYDVPVIDADRVYHELLLPPSPCLDALCDAFSRAILAPDGSLNRAALATLVFEDSPSGRKKRALLNELTHRFVIERTDELLCAYREQGKRAVLINPLCYIYSGYRAILCFTCRNVLHCIIFVAFFNNEQ